LCDALRPYERGDEIMLSPMPMHASGFYVHLLVIKKA
jgi:hypothetical protein